MLDDKPDELVFNFVKGDSKFDLLDFEDDYDIFDFV